MTDRTTQTVAIGRKQLETLARVARGETLDSIARDQWLTSSAIGMRLRRLYVKLGARSAPHAVAIAYERGLLPLPAEDAPTEKSNEPADALRPASVIVCNLDDYWRTSSPLPDHTTTDQEATS